MSASHPYSSFIRQVDKPARYLGGERNQVRKDWDSARLRMCLAFPDLYDIGMSHLGTKILYKVLAETEGVLAERAFAPWADMEAQLRERELPILSLEGARPLAEFDVVGCSLQYELTYTNVLLMLDLSGIPLRSADRGEGDPLVIGGGPCATHPEPCAPFFDAFLIGDAEAELPAAMLELADLKEAGASRDARLRALARRGGWYVPGLYRVEIEERTGVQVVVGPIEGAEADAPMPVVRRLVEDLAEFPFPDDSPVAAAEAIFDRMSVEIARGCTEGCRFCQAGMIYRPVRERDPEEIVDTLVSAVKKGGFDEASLTSLSTADYSCINPLIKKVARKLAAENVSLSVSSLRAYGLSEDVLDDMRAVKAGGLTFAPEAGSQRMRDVVNKNVSDEDIDESAHRIFSRGWDKAKLYFMIGLPSEQDDDVMGIVETGKRVRDIGRTYLGGKGARVTVSVSSHVPKPHTPFQWAKFDSADELERKQGMLKDAARRSGVKLRTHNKRGSVIEASMARGDRRLADVIERAYRKGCRFDGWDNLLNWEAWLDSFEEAGVDWTPFLSTLPTDVPLAWDHIDVGLAPGFLKREYKRALKDRLSPPCAKPVGQLVHHTNVAEAAADARKLVCYHCGVACDLDAMNTERIDFLQRMGSDQPDSLDAGAPQMSVLAALQPGERRSRGTMKPPQRPEREGLKVRYRLRYGKTGLAALTGHLDLVREMPRLLRRAQLRPWLTQGFKPRPILTFGPALRLGWQAAADLVDICVEHRGENPPPTAAQVAEALTRESSDGLEFIDGRLLADHEKPLSKRLAAADWVVVAPEGVLERIADVDPDVAVWIRKDKDKSKPWSEVVLEHGVRLAAGLPERLQIAPDLQVFTVRLAHDHSVPRPTEILAQLTGADAEELADDCSAARVRLWMADDSGALVDALSSPCEASAAA